MTFPIIALDDIRGFVSLNNTFTTNICSYRLSSVIYLQRLLSALSSRFQFASFLHKCLKFYCFFLSLLAVVSLYFLFTIRLPHFSHALPMTFPVFLRWNHITEVSDPFICGEILQNSLPYCSKAKRSRLIDLCLLRRVAEIAEKYFVASLDRKEKNKTPVFILKDSCSFRLWDPCGGERDSRYDSS